MSSFYFSLLYGCPINLPQKNGSQYFEKRQNYYIREKVKDKCKDNQKYLIQLFKNSLSLTVSTSNQIRKNDGNKEILVGGGGRG